MTLLGFDRFTKGGEDYIFCNTLQQRHRIFTGNKLGVLNLLMLCLKLNKFTLNSTALCCRLARTKTEGTLIVKQVRS